ncbi:hypothetical protein VSH64_25070 [Amycolatopsis rhabdoformis]|uniref:PH domain-containing protein n=1 Tax=Amycolatopsis rhabdoformis TaxID=1448059 RepID=A0ABZ1HVQ9_9PSEU|nr:hypothetical protein [Amycolatopsis rhabdoformis]WSE26150.1 hypothetical protein VSH64_25070 [Amycolatopsis rhabdoformis]
MIDTKSTEVRMDPEIKAKWIAALRSGEYEQGKRVLVENDRFCCLGVLCDLAAQAGVVVRFSSQRGFESTSDPRDVSELSLPRAVEAWAKLGSFDPKVGGYALSTWNDSRDATFSEIADLIEAHL